MTSANKYPAILIQLGIMIFSMAIVAYVTVYGQKDYTHQLVMGTWGWMAIIGVSITYGAANIIETWKKVP